MARNCIVCNDNAYAAKYCVIDHYDYLRCKSCGLIYVDKVERTENLYRSYSGGSFKSFRRRVLAPIRRFSHTRHFEESMGRGRQIFEFASSHGNDENGQRWFLDIGCNKGFLLAAGIERGWNVYGVEIVPELTMPFKNTYHRFRDQVFVGRFADCRGNFEPDTFSLITAIDVIEHLEDVIEDLKGVYEILRPGGTFVIQTPDTACERAAASGCDWGALKPLEHLHLFNSANLATLAHRVGFIDVQHFSPFEEADGNFTAVLKK
ncbi:MAG: class I SAM-dependent methyltransferase [Acidiferrobacterales bacterium]